MLSIGFIWLLFLSFMFFAGAFSAFFAVLRSIDSNDIVSAVLCAALCYLSYTLMGGTYDEAWKYY